MSILKSVRSLGRVVCAVGALLLLQGASCSSSSGPSQQSSKSWSDSVDTIPWRHDYAAALDEGRKTGKPVLIDFSATWCGPCQQMKRTSWPDTRVSQLASGSYIPVALDVDDASARPAAERYDVSSIPEVLIVKANGDVVRNQVGLMSADELADFLAVR